MVQKKSKIKEVRSDIYTLEKESIFGHKNKEEKNESNIREISKIERKNKEFQKHSMKLFLNKNGKFRFFHQKIFLFSLIIFIIIPTYFTLICKSVNISKLVIISLKFKGPSGRKKIFHQGTTDSERITYTTPDEVYIDDVNTNSIDNERILNEGSKVTLLWKGNIDNCNHLFYHCSDITEISFPYFDTSKVTEMFGMFNGCTSLESLDVSKFNTENVENMGNMFYDCQSLTSLDVSNFITSKTENLGTLFTNCKLLKSIDVSNFDTSNAKYIDSMFSGCEK